ncbi:MAG: hypothetical protein JSW12_16570 [Deltaproteobacteria bacterium]|nr:MAG: hypothetical protein JSW12_16570 [Deltaproteobacteria bacterium]
MNSRHLSDREISSALLELEGIDEDLRSHLNKCPNCRKRLDTLKGFTKSFQEHTKHSDINWAIERGKILSGLSDNRLPLLGRRWGTAFVFSLILIASALLLRQLSLKPQHTLQIEETELLKTIYICCEDMGEVELPRSLLVLSPWGREDFRQFLNFFSPLEEERDEKKDVIDDSLSNHRIDYFHFT